MNSFDKQTIYAHVVYLLLCVSVFLLECHHITSLCMYYRTIPQTPVSKMWGGSVFNFLFSFQRAASFSNVFFVCGCNLYLYTNLY